jgi:hypothetical protein
MIDKRNDRTYVVQVFDKFENLTTTDWKYPSDVNIICEHNWINKNKRPSETFNLNLRRIQSPKTDQLFLDYFWKGEKLFFFNSGNLIINCDGKENIVLYADDTDERNSLNSGWAMSGFYFLSKEELKKICRATNLAIRVSEERYNFEIEGDGLLKFQFMCRTFYSEVFNDNSYDSWINTEISKASERKSTKGCFIATAVMGDYCHPVVIDLRNFRDNWLIKRDWGRLFTKWYYLRGPQLANFIEKSTILKKITYYLLIWPLHFIIKKLNFEE